MSNNDIILKLQSDTVKSYMQSHNIKHIRLAGSFARGEQNTESDIDIVYDEQDPENTDLELLSMPLTLEKNYLGRPVDLLYKYGINRHVRDFILHDMIPIW